MRLFRRFLHLFGIHYWGPWSMPVAVTLYAFTYTVIQDRYCLICWQYDKKKIGWGFIK